MFAETTGMQFEIVHITSLFENATEGFIVTDSTAKIILANPSACRMFNYTTEELIGQKIEILIPSHYRHGHEKLRNDFYKDPTNRVMGHGRDLHGEKKGGQTFPVEVSLSTYLQNGQRYVIAFIIDITHRKEIEKSMVQQQQELQKMTQEMRVMNSDLEAKVEERTQILKEALQKLEQSQDELSAALAKERELNEIKGRFVSMASHEFRTPLSTVLSSASLLSKYEKSEDQEKRSRHIEKIKGSVKHLNDLLEDFLSLGRLDEGKIGANLEVFNLEDLFIDVVEEMRGLARKDQIISFTYEGEKEVYSDKKLVKNILINLISNALKFSGEGDQIFVFAKTDSKQVEIRISDSGIGISAEDIEHLFSSFYRGKNATNIQGTGLGLHIVKRYLHLLRGDIKVNSELGKGTSFTVLIPNDHS